jgi:hypothetical protein
MERGTHEVVIAFDTDQGNGWGIYFCWERPSDQPEERAFPQRME